MKNMPVPVRYSGWQPASILMICLPMRGSTMAAALALLRMMILPLRSAMSVVQGLRARLNHT